MTLVAITTNKKHLIKQCLKLSKEFNLPYTEQTSDFDYLLNLDDNYLSLIKTTNKKLKPFIIDFCHGKIAYRGARANMELLAKAIGVKKLKTPDVLDATAGLGRDGFLLASLGCKVTMLENNAVLYLLLKDALERYQSSNMKPTYLRLLHQDAKEFLKLGDKFSVIYLDPMFPVRNKSALVKKDMQFLHDIVGLTQDSDELFFLSLNKTKNRLVVKRPLYAESLANVKPDICYKGRAIRFDIYFKR